MKHPPCLVCGCQNVNVLADAIADAVIRRQELDTRIDADLALDHKRGPLHDGSHPGCLVCAPLREERAPA
jgi:hypothetical protein